MAPNQQAKILRAIPSRAKNPDSDSTLLQSVQDPSSGPHSATTQSKPHLDSLPAWLPSPLCSLQAASHRAKRPTAPENFQPPTASPTALPHSPPLHRAHVPPQPLLVVCSRPLDLPEAPHSRASAPLPGQSAPVLSLAHSLTSLETLMGSPSSPSTSNRPLLTPHSHLLTCSCF